jgi:putative transposase
MCRWLDNAAIEIFWRSIKDEDIYLKSYETIRELEKGIKAYITRHTEYRPHQSLNESTPEERYSGEIEIAV